MSAIKQAAEYLELTDLTTYLTNIINKDQFLNKDLEQSYLMVSITVLVIRNITMTYSSRIQKRHTHSVFNYINVNFYYLLLV